MSPLQGTGRAPKVTRYEQHPLDVYVPGLDEPVGRVASITYENDVPVRIELALFDGHIVVAPAEARTGVPGRGGPVHNSAGHVIAWWGK